MWNKGTLGKLWGVLERSINIIAAVATVIPIVIIAIAAITGHWDWRTMCFIMMAVTLVCIGVAFYGYRSRVAVRMFTGVSKAERMCQADQYAAKRIAEAKRSVWDFAWQDDKESHPQTDPPAVVRDAGSKALDEAIRGAIVGSTVYYHEIITTKAYSKLLRKHIGYCREIPHGKTLNYRARIYDNTRKGYRKFPKIQFVIIDEEEVVFLSSGYEYCFSMKSRKTASVFLKYAHMAWEQADEWTKGVRDVVLNGKVVDNFDHHLEGIISRIDSGNG